MAIATVWLLVILTDAHVVERFPTQNECLRVAEEITTKVDRYFPYRCIQAQIVITGKLQ